MRRRDFLKLVGGAAAALALGSCGDEEGELPPEPELPSEESVAHLLPTASHDRILVKVSFTEAQTESPDLWVDGRRVAGVRTDSAGLFWAFDAQKLEPSRRYTLELRRGRRRLTEPWELSTLPHPESRPERFRLLAYTCAGGHDLFPIYNPVPVRRRLLQRALSFEPDVVLANGDHVYWDLRAGISAILLGKSQAAIEFAGVFDREAPVLGHPNEEVLKKAVSGQIVSLYGTMLRSVPVFFLRDDHDYFEDDQVTPELTTFPPDDFMRKLARASQWLYYPEFLPDPNRPRSLPASDSPDRFPGTSEAFGTLRYGRLFEGLLYECKGFVVLGPEGGLVPRSVEDWLHSRMGESDADYVVHFPGNPPGWTAGKYAEWYPDVLGEDGKLTTSVPKPGWQASWQDQHDRILESASRMRRLPLFVSGDIHSIAEGRILRAREIDLSANPVVSLITGTPGTGLGWPSAARGTLATPPIDLEVEEVVPVQEINGFHILDFEPDRVTIRHFRWNRYTDSVESIDTLEPFHVSEYRNPRA
ncbi:MAG: hypothetical protein KatS3mg076_2388 [Candidatus Binatia bacterium]|nr:MAG: hypothetical protein KatS3mg076_2388 [Candidatus Binatia bacterium]